MDSQATDDPIPSSPLFSTSTNPVHLTRDASDLRCVLARVADGCALLVIGIGLLAMAGWLFGIDLLTRVLPDLESMKFNTRPLLRALWSGAMVARTAGSADRARRAGCLDWRAHADGISVGARPWNRSALCPRSSRGARSRRDVCRRLQPSVSCSPARRSG